ncbi:MAG TPA: hypothetical protein PL009_04915 [Flavipsychrobacter sp.]|nr:hypothetical protein [Flavipsychrobacter sp.]
MKKVLLSFFALAISLNVFAQLSKADITNGDNEITWLGVDFTQLKFIGSATQWKDAGEISNSQLRDKYFPAWNNLFINEQKKYNVADAVGRAEVKYALDVTEKANNGIKGDLFSEDPNDYSRLTDQKIAQLVGKYDYQGNKGIGMLLFAESFSKGKEEGAIWVTFVDMNTRKLLLTKKLNEPAGGFGFKNFWAKTLFGALKDTGKNLKKWSKG